MSVVGLTSYLVKIRLSFLSCESCMRPALDVDLCGEEVEAKEGFTRYLFCCSRHCPRHSDPIVSGYDSAVVSEPMSIISLS